MPDNNKHNSDPIENLFREKSKEYDISYRESDWESLEKRLDVADQKYYTRRRRNIAAVIAFLIVSLLGFLIYSNYMEINRLNEELSQAEETIESQQNQTEPTIENQGQSQNTRQNESKILADKEDDNTDDETRMTDKTIEPVKQSVSAETTEISATPSLASIDCESCDQTNPTPFGNLSNSLANASIPPTKDSDQTQISSVIDQKQQFVNANPPSSSSRLSMSVVAGPDLSSAGSLSGFKETGTKFGATVNYQLNNRFSISLGAIRSDVRYTARGSEYHPPSGYWKYGIQASETYARCIIIDIPLSLSYQLAEFQKSRLIASATAASYIMVSEDYKFTYENQGYDLPDEWKENTGTKHLFSNLGFSVGYEYDLSNSISIKAEPFIRIPIREVGWGNVRLYSTGTLFSLTYKLH